MRRNNNAQLLSIIMSVIPNSKFGEWEGRSKEGNRGEGEWNWEGERGGEWGWKKGRRKGKGVRGEE